MRSGLLFVCILLVGCNGNNLSPSISLEGSWVETDTKTDTLKFPFFSDNESSMILARGREIRNGHDLPKLGSGPYDYKILGNVISLRSMFSSSMTFNNYYFKQDGDIIVIGDFFNPNSAGKKLTFKKL